MKRLLSYQNPYLDRSLHAVEMGLAFYLFFGGISTASAKQVHSGSAIGQALGSHTGLVLFGVTFMITGITLLLSRILDNDRLHGYTLMASYVIMTFTFCAELLLKTGAIDSFTLAVISGYLYLRAKRLEPWRKK